MDSRSGGGLNGTANTLTILLGNGDGTFTAAATSPATGISPFGIVVADFNGDGKPDLAVANEQTNTVTVLLGNGDGTFIAGCRESDARQCLEFALRCRTSMAMAFLT